MIRNLNKLTFSGYGKVLQDRLPNRGFPQGDTWQETFWTITDQERPAALPAKAARCIWTSKRG